jgi:GT2 family glycosyltransferase
MRILIVIVRYKTPLASSQTLVSLSDALRAHPELQEKTGILVWDNSPSPLVERQLPFAFEYRHSGENLGVSGAYNRAMEFAESQGFEWMLLLDQDTTLPVNFLSRMLEYSRTMESDTRIAAIAPFLVDGTLPSSPSAVLCGRNKLVVPPFSGVYPGEVFAANSGTLMRVSALREVGGYSEDFWLDLSDVVTFRRLHARGKRLYLAGDLQVQHKITNNDYDGSMSPQRYLNFIAAEGAYWDLYRTALPRAIYTARLLGRVVRQYRRLKNKVYSAITWRYFCQRFLTSKDARLQRWKQQSLNRNIPAISAGRVVG